MADLENKESTQVKETAAEAIRNSRGQGKLRQFVLWMAALVIGAVLG